MHITLRKTELRDLEHHFRFQLDPEANYLAAFTSPNPADRAAYLKKHTKLLTEGKVRHQTILADGRIVGSIARFEMEGKEEITYWIDKAHWGEGVATSALGQFLQIEKSRPLFGRVASDNFGSQRVLEKCGFLRIGKDKSFAPARNAETEELIYRLD